MMTLKELLKKLDLTEYEAKINAAGIHDARAPRPFGTLEPISSPPQNSRRWIRSQHWYLSRREPTQVPTLARLTDDQLDGFGMRKLEKRKLLHHLQGATPPDAGEAVLC